MQTRLSWDETLKLWDVSSGQATLEGHSGPVSCIDWSIDGLLASGSWDDTVKIWNLSSSTECLKTLEGHSSSVSKVVFSQDGAMLVSSDGLETFCRDVATGARKDKVAGQFASTKTQIGRYIVTEIDDLILVYTQGGVVNADGEEKVLSALFRAPSPIMSVRCAGDKIAVDCQSGAVLTLHAAWLTD